MSTPSPFFTFAGPTTFGLTLKDVRESVERLNALRSPRIDYVRVSDGWWVILTDGEPTGKISDALFQRALAEVEQEMAGQPTRPL